MGEPPLDGAVQVNVADVLPFTAPTDKGAPGTVDRGVVMVA